eukprot:7063660-Pyramimonas_sp.AAC.1
MGVASMGHTDRGQTFFRLSEGALGKRKLEEDVETEGEPQQKKSNCDGEVENGTDQPVMDAPAHAEGEAPVATPEEPVVESICQQ